MTGRLIGYPRCWQCGERLDGFADPSNAEKEPERGDASVCTNCAAIGTFDLSPEHGLVLRRPTLCEGERYEQDVALQFMVNVIRSVQRQT
jgi:hypothetical protein